MATMSGQVQDVSARLGQLFQQLVPLRLEPTKGKKPSAKEIDKAMEGALKQFYAAASEERTRNRLGIIGRARVAFQLQQHLTSAGYPPPLVKQVLIAMIVSAFVG